MTFSEHKSNESATYWGYNSFFFFLEVLATLNSPERLIHLYVWGHLRYSGDQAV